MRFKDGIFLSLCKSNLSWFWTSLSCSFRLTLLLPDLFRGPYIRKGILRQSPLPWSSTSSFSSKKSLKYKIPKYSTIKPWGSRLQGVCCVFRHNLHQDFYLRRGQKSTFTRIKTSKGTFSPVPNKKHKRWINFKQLQVVFPLIFLHFVSFYLYFKCWTGCSKSHRVHKTGWTTLTDPFFFFYLCYSSTRLFVLELQTVINLMNSILFYFHKISGSVCLCGWN